MELGAYLQVYKNNGRAAFALKNFRKHYPHSPIYLVSDQGDDFTELAGLQNCKYEYSNQNTGVGPLGFDKSQIFIWLDRFYRCCEYCDTEYVLYMEDDVYVRGHIDINKDQKISGALVGNVIPDIVMEYFKAKYNCAFSINQYGACGGTLYNRQVFVDNFDKIKKMIEEDYDHIIRIYPIFGNLDIFMTIAFTMLGYPYFKNGNMIDNYDTPNWRNTSHPIVHMNNDGVYTAFIKE